MYIIISEQKKIKEKIKKRGISMKRIMSVIISLFLILSLSGCGIVESVKHLADAFRNDTDVSEEENVPEKEVENSITIGVVELDTYNPLVSTSPTLKNMLGFIFEPMFGVDEAMNTEGILAYSYQTSIDGTSITVNLKEGVTWHDGTPFTADDVVYTVNELKRGGTNYDNVAQTIRSIEKAGVYAVKITFDYPMTNPTANLYFPIIKSQSANGDNFSPVGTGPYRMDSGQLTAFESYHNGRAAIDTIKVTSIPDNKKFASMFNASVIDIADSDMIDMTSYMPKSNSVVHDYVSGNMIFVGYNAKSSVFANEEARRAVSKIIDRRSIVSHIYFSRAEATVYPVNPKSRMYPTNSGGAYGDNGLAQKELSQNGWKSDKRGVFFKGDTQGVTYFSVEILVNSDDAERVKIAEEISQAMNNIGMKNTLTKCTQTQFSERIESGNYDMFVGETELLPSNDLTRLLKTGMNIFNYSDEETDILLSQLGTQLSENDAKDIWLKLCERIDEKSPISPICFLKKSLITGAKIKTVAEPSVESSVRKTEKWSVK